MSTTTEDVVVDETTTSDDDGQAVEAPEAPLTAAQAALAEWTDLSPRLFRQDQALIAFLEENERGTEKAIREALPQLSSWSFRRLATGVHHKAQRGDPIIVKVKHEGTTYWTLAEQYRPEKVETEQPVEDNEVPAEQPAEQNGSSRRSRRSGS